MTAQFRSDKIGQAVIELADRLWHLLAQEVKRRQLIVAGVADVELDIVTNRVRQPKPVDAARRKRILGDDLIQQFLRILEKFTRLRANRRIVKDCRIPPAQLPRVKERRPVDVIPEVADWWANNAGARPLRFCWNIIAPIERWL